MRLDRLPRRQLLLLYLGTMALWALLGLVGLVLALPPFIAAVSEVRHEERRLVQDQTTARLLPVRQQAHARLVEELGALEPTVETRRYVPTLVDQTAQMASDNGLELLGTAPAQEDTDSLLQGQRAEAGRNTWRVTLTLAGHYPELLKFIQALQQAPKALAVRSLDVRAAQPVGAGRLLVTLDLLAREVPGILAQPTPQPVVHPWLLTSPGPAPAPPALPGVAPLPGQGLQPGPGALPGAAPPAPVRPTLPLPAPSATPLPGVQPAPGAPGAQAAPGAAPDEGLPGAGTERTPPRVGAPASPPTRVMRFGPGGRFDPRRGGNAPRGQGRGANGQGGATLDSQSGPPTGATER